MPQNQLPKTLSALLDPHDPHPLIARVTSRLPPDSVERVAREVVERLAFRVPKASPDRMWPTDDDIASFCDMILLTEGAAGEKFVSHALKTGTTLDCIYHGYLAGAARRLGHLWDEDVITFAQVAVGSTRLYRIVRSLRPAFAATGDQPGARVFLTLTPGDTHTLGIEMAGDVLRRANWDVGVGLDDHPDRLVASCEDFDPTIVVVVANSASMLEALLRLVVSLRIALPRAVVVVAGNLVDKMDDLAGFIGADGVLTQIDTASDTLTDILAQV